jgi:hypothetical protein
MLRIFKIEYFITPYLQGKIGVDFKSNPSIKARGHPERQPLFITKLNTHYTSKH